jgi:hypothetical protein
MTLDPFYFPWGSRAPRSLGGAMFVYIYATLIWFLKFSSSQIAAQHTKIMIHLGTNNNYPLSYMITFLQVQALDFSME